MPSRKVAAILALSCGRESPFSTSHQYWVVTMYAKDTLSLRLYHMLCLEQLGVKNFTFL